MADPPKGQRHDRNALILYGSETGNSQDVAEELGRVAERLHFVTRVSEMDAVEISFLVKYTVVLFAVSTTGQGEFPNNARKFWKSLLRKRLPPGCLDHVSFTTFGLGDSSYPRFNWSARKLHKRLEQLGAKEVYPRGEADEQHSEGIDGTFLSWSADLAKHLLSSFPLPEGLIPIPSGVLLPPKYRLEILDVPDMTAQSKEFGLVWTPPVEVEPPTPCEQVRDHLPEGVGVPKELEHPPAASVSTDGTPTDVKLVGNRRITPESHWQDVRELTFIMSDQYEYLPGETMTIFPKNFPEDVEALIDLMDWVDVADIPLKLLPESPNFYLDPHFIPGGQTPGLFPLPGTTLRQLLIHNLDITAIPKRHFFEIIAHYTDDPMHKQRLLDFTNPAFTDEFYDYATRPRRSILEVLQDFPSVKLPWKFVISFFPVIRGRAYSIATGGQQRLYHREKHVIKLQLIVALVKYRTVLKKVRQGLCSRYLASLPEGTEMHVKFEEHEKFYDPCNDHPKRPIILIAPGTGIAPCRALIWDRAELNMKQTIGKAYLFYGGRNRDADFFYEDEWNKASLRTTVFTAFSRDQKEKIYVQDIIRREGKLIEHLIRKEEAIIYVCGSSGAMPKAVKEALIDAFQKNNSRHPRREQVEGYFEKLEKDGRYIQETW